MSTFTAEWMPLREAAKALCVDDETIRLWIRRGALTARKNDRRRVEVLRTEIEQALGRNPVERALAAGRGSSAPGR